MQRSHFSIDTAGCVGSFVIRLQVTLKILCYGCVGSRHGATCLGNPVLLSAWISVILAYANLICVFVLHCIGSLSFVIHARTTSDVAHGHFAWICEIQASLLDHRPSSEIDKGSHGVVPDKPTDNDLEDPRSPLDYNCRFGPNCRSLGGHPGTPSNQMSVRRGHALVPGG